MLQENFKSGRLTLNKNADMLSKNTHLKEKLKKKRLKHETFRYGK